ncbi:hypothetical protein C8J57DRAFT_1706468 [Mycena rebaudengoi]|nr:hypothetical protein C8J57DRAFT_1706468 [Mycena rebaudengoi]
MADFTEFRAPAREQPTFVKPLDTASRRRSRISHDSAAASTRSWVLMNQQSPPPPVSTIPIPPPISALAGTPPPVARPLPELPTRTASVIPGVEHMTVERAAADAETGYGYQGKGRDTKSFVGGFVSGLRRLPRALVRNRRGRRGTVGTEGTSGTVVSGNTLPRYVETPPPTPEIGGTDNAGGGFLRVGDDAQGQRQRHPSFRVVPPDVDPDDPTLAAPPPCPDNAGDLGAPEDLDLPPLDNPYEHEGAAPPPAAPTPAVSLHPSRTEDRPAGDGDEPVSVHAHPLPTGDYRRMSATNAAQPHSRTTISSGSFSADSPSFSSELNGFHRFFHALHLLPWVATDRVTADYLPKGKSKALVSWYHPEELLPSGEDTLNAPPTSPAALSPSSGSASHRPSASRPRAHRRHASESDTPLPPPTLSYPFAYAYPAYSPPPRSKHPSSHARSRRSPAQHHARHHRRSATMQGWSPPLLPAPPTPVYVIQATPPPSASELPPGEDAARLHDPHGMQGQMMAPVYMRMRHASPGYAYGYGPGYSPIPMPAPAQSS